MNKPQEINGKIIKGIAGFYYVKCEDENLLMECRAKGILRRNQDKPLVGDNVTVTVLDREKQLGNLTAVLERKNELLRPAVANVDQVLIFFAACTPDPNFLLLDRILAGMKALGIECIICFNKEDLAVNGEAENAAEIYAGCGSTVLTLSVEKKTGLTELRELLEHKTTAIAGPSGAGKSSLMNALYPEAGMLTGEISQKTERGKHTTRHTELFCIGGDTYVMDTPGFTALEYDNRSPEEIMAGYPEFLPYEPKCRFGGCSHITEKDCGVREALEEHKINKVRYDNYCQLYHEVQDKRKYRQNYRKGSKN